MSEHVGLIVVGTIAALLAVACGYFGSVRLRLWLVLAGISTAMPRVATCSTVLVHQPQRVEDIPYDLLWFERKVDARERVLLIGEGDENSDWKTTEHVSHLADFSVIVDGRDVHVEGNEPTVLGYETLSEFGFLRFRKTAIRYLRIPEKLCVVGALGEVDGRRILRNDPELGLLLSSFSLASTARKVGASSIAAFSSMIAATIVSALSFGVWHAT